MNRRVLKWTVPVDDQRHPIGAGPVVHVECQAEPDSVQVWTLEGDAEPAMTTAQVFGTGHALPTLATRHLGSTVTAGGSLVWHVFEVLA